MAKWSEQFKRYLPKQRPAVLALVVISVGILGGITLFVSHAATNVTSIEAENGTISGNAQKITSSSASGGAAVKFGAGTSTGGSGPYLPYTADSFFKATLPANAPIDPTNAAGINFLKTSPDQKLSYPIINGIKGSPTGAAWGTVYFEGSCSDPVWKLTGTVPAAVSFLTTEGFHAPAKLGTTLTGTSDSPFVVMDRCGDATMPNGLSVWGAKASVAGTQTITVGAAGAFQHDSNGLDKRAAGSTSNLNFRSRGAIPDAMVIRHDRMVWAIQNNTDLGYVLHMFWPATGPGHVFPMVGDEGDKGGWGQEGMRIRIKPSVDLTKLNFSPAGLVLAKTLQDYGAYIGDNAGGGATLKAEEDYGQWGGILSQDALKSLTWDDFEFIQGGYQ